jgi:Protein of unknown function (DUF2442)
MATPEWIKRELRTNFARASRAGRQAAKTEPRAARAAYHVRDNTLRIELTNGAVISVPVRLIPALKRASPSQVRSVEVLGRGGGLHWEALDVDLSVPGLVSSVFAGPEWMAELGRVGGRRSSAAKAVAARRNGRKGGRPRTRTGAITEA